MLCLDPGLLHVDLHESGQRPVGHSTSSASPPPVGGRLGQPEDLVRWADFLRSDAADDLSGTVITVRPRTTDSLWADSAWRVLRPINFFGRRWDDRCAQPGDPDDDPQAEDHRVLQPGDANRRMYAEVTEAARRRPLAAARRSGLLRAARIVVAGSPSARSTRPGTRLLSLSPRRLS